MKPEEINLNFKNQSWDPERRVKGKVWPKLKKILEMEDYASYPPNEPTCKYFAFNQFFLNSEILIRY